MGYVRTWALNTVLLGFVTSLAALTPSAALALTSANNTPFPSSTVIAGAKWVSARHGAPNNQSGDILPTPWGDDDNLYTLMDDGGANVPLAGGLWRNSFAQITGGPLKPNFKRIGVSPPPATWSQIHKNRALWTGPLGPYYSTGFAVVNHVFYATQVHDWQWGANGPFQGLAGIAYSTDHGAHWRFPGKAFPGATGNLNWVQWGRASLAPDGYVYAIASEREFNASSLILGRSRADIADMTDPAKWQWASGWKAVPSPFPNWSSSIAQATPILTWANHLTYPRMAYDQGLHRYLLSFTYSYAPTPPGLWRNGEELVVLDAPHPWGPFSFVTRGSYFGPSNGYDPAFPVKWISQNGQDLWMIWSANFDGCAKGLMCSASYGFNRQRMHLIPATSATRKTRAALASRAGKATSTGRPAPPAAWRGLPATAPRFQLPRLLGVPGP
jgi:hypothetical protein